MKKWSHDVRVRSRMLYTCVCGVCVSICVCVCAHLCFIYAVDIRTWSFMMRFMKFEFGIRIVIVLEFCE